MRWLWLYLLLINVITLLVYGSDKRRARKGKWRISEKTLFLLPAIGGSVGALAGMYLFRHKTNHWYFRLGLPAILLVQMALAAWILYP
ncbi:MAG: DUF1294 domain-containing protein [Ruminococcaceae bacterium]|nr:DUF1294 domain-containing protein [Oscillospiraceae bacterium]